MYDEEISPPKLDELELSLFGPGYGECLALHYGDAKWMVVDSCLDPDDKKPSVLKYFDEIGVNPASDVSHFVVTHPDNDHIRGAAEVFRACASATFVCSAAFTEREMVQYAAVFSAHEPSDLTPTTKELWTLFEDATTRSTQQVFAIQDRVVLHNEAVKITALSPSDAKLQKFLKRISAALPKESEPRRKPAAITPNAASLVLVIESNQANILLGADLEENPGGGWTDILSQSAVYPHVSKIKLFKIPHHGSSNAHHDGLWDGFDDGVIAVLCPFSNGGVHLPTSDDVSRIRSAAAQAYSSSSFKSMKVKCDHEVSKHLKLHGIGHRRRTPSTGHIRIRIGEDQTPKVKLFGKALSLENFS